MIVELVRFKAPSNDWQSILEDAKTTVPRWRAEPHLLRKHYLLGEDGYCAGLYIWLSREHAQKAHDEAWRANIRRRSGSEPTIVYYDLLMLVDNEAGTVTEWSKEGEKVVAPAA